MRKMKFNGIIKRADLAQNVRVIFNDELVRFHENTQIFIKPRGDRLTRFLRLGIVGSRRKGWNSLLGDYRSLSTRSTTTFLDSRWK